MADKITTSKSWKIKDMPIERGYITINRIIPFEDMKLIFQGCKPSDMGDKWFMYCDEYSIRIYRSWSGDCIFIGYFETFKSDFIITQLAVNQNRLQYNRKSDDKEGALFFNLLDSFREKKRNPEPVSQPTVEVGSWNLPLELRLKFANGEIDADEFSKQVLKYIKQQKREPREE